jgi:hypothetical protein
MPLDTDGVLALFEESSVVDEPDGAASCTAAKV